MNSVKVKRTIKFIVRYEDDSKDEAMESLKEIMARRDMPIPFKVSGSRYEIERVWR